MSAVHASRGDWPEQPYKGLAFYTREDRRLFAGRERDIQNCMQRLTKHTTSVLLLYGRTGCGKSSFLRAGLIPAMEESLFSFSFLSRLRDSGRVPVFVRSTEDPLRRIADAIWSYLEAPTIGRGELVVDLSKAKLGANSRLEYVDTCRKPKELLSSLRIISRQLPSTLIIVLDQAEEVLTLSGEDKEPKLAFFDFLKLFLASQISLKFLVALRSEYLGPFMDLSRIESLSRWEFTQYELQKPTREQVSQAILRPTRSTDLAEQPPYDFDFETDVVNRLLVEETRRKSPAVRGASIGQRAETKRFWRSARRIG